MDLALPNTATAPEAFREWLARRGWTQRIAAEQLDVHYTFVNQLVRGISTPGLRVALRIEQIAGIPARDWLSTAIDKKPATTRKRARKR